MTAASISVMNATTSNERSPTAPATQPAARRMIRAVLALIAGSLVVLLLVLVWLSSRAADQRAIRALPPIERMALYTRTMGNIEALCVDYNSSFSDYCKREAEFISNFEECDVSCQVLVRRILAADRARR